MPNIAGINDHNGSNAEVLAARYKKSNTRDIFPDVFDWLEKTKNEDKKLKILDIGAGSGDYDLIMANLGHDVVAIEHSDLRQIAIRDNFHPNIEYRDGLLPKLDAVKAGEEFDLVFMAAVWQYIDPEERVESLVRIADTLKPEGRLILSYPSPPTRKFQFEVSPEELKADIAAANRLLPANKKLSLADEPIITTKEVDGCDISFYKFTIETGHAQSIDRRGSWVENGI